MASEENDSLSGYDHELLILYGRSIGITRARSMRRDTLCTRLKGRHDNEADLIDAITTYNATQSNNNNNNDNNDQKSIEPAEESDAIPMKLYLTVSGHPI
eukprot:249997_1